MAIRISTYSALTDALTGLATINIKVPGTFGGLVPGVTGFQGRRLIKIGVWLESRVTQDSVTSLAISDLDSKLPSPLTGATLTNLIDQSVDAGSRALTLIPGGDPFQIDFPTDPGNPAYNKAIIPSELYIVVTFTKAVAGVDRAVVNVAWDDFT